MPVEAFDQGVVTSQAAGRLKRGEMTEATGVVYRQGDPRATKLGGRSSFGETVTNEEIVGVALCKFDTEANDLLLALVDNTTSGNKELYKKDPTAAAATAWTLLSQVGLGSQLSAAHYNDQWFIASGGTRNYVLSDAGTVRRMSMQPPVGQPTATPKTGTIDIRPTAHSDPGAAWFNETLAYDTDVDTGAYAVLSAAGSAALTLDWTTSDTGSDRHVRFRFTLNADPAADSDAAVPVTRDDAGYNVTVTITWEDGGAGGAETIFTGNFTANTRMVTVDAEVTDAAEVNGGQAVVTLTYNSGTNACQMTLFDAKVSDGGGATAFTVSQPLLYAFAEYNETTGLQGPRSQILEVDNGGSAFNSVELSPPSISTLNSDTTHWKVYRAPPGGTQRQLGFIGYFPVISSPLQLRDTFLDDFSPWGVNDQPVELYPYVLLGDLAFDRDTPAPAMKRFRFFDGSVVGFPVDNNRALAYSLPGYPESWPAIYRIDKFSLEEHDELVDGLEVSGSFLVWAKGAVFRMDRLPQTIGGQVVDSEVTKIAGAPGAAGKYPVAKVELDGQQMAAWISDFGIYVTTGHVYRRISDNIDWSGLQAMDKSAWALHYDKRERLLRFCYSSTDGGGNDRYALIHLDPDHIRDDGQPKWTLPHYGKINALTAGRVSNGYRVYSGHTTDGKVYREDDAATGADASQALSGTTHRLKITSRKRYAGRDEYEIHGGFLFHSDFGSGEVLTLAHTVGRDVSGSTTVKSQTVSLSSEKETQFDVGRAGRWSQVSLTHDGTGLGSLSDISEDFMQGDSAGKQGAA